MKPSEITISARLMPFYQPSRISEPKINKPIANNHSYKPLLTPKKIKPSAQFDSAVAHELRSPLTTINLSVDMLKSTIKDPDLNVYLDVIMRSSIRINNLIDELLKVKHENKIIAKQHSIHGLLEEVLDIAKDRIGLKDILVRKDFMARDCSFLFDRAKMKIALTNIIMNAIDAITSTTCEKGELKLSTKSLQGKCFIEIEDNGCGIDEKDIKHIFKPYFTNKPGGLGLGLSTTYDILHANHVKVTVESEKGKGTRFILSLDTDGQTINF